MDKILPYFLFDGRANRQRYWLTGLAIYGLLLVGVFGFMWIPIVGIVTVALLGIAALWCFVALAVRRLHDRNKRGWWLLLMYLPALVFGALSQIASMSEPAVGGLFALLGLPFSVWAIVELGFLKGTVGPNRFGPDRLQPAPVEVFS